MKFHKILFRFARSLMCRGSTSGPFPNSHGNRFILVIVDYVSKWAEASSLPTSDTRAVVKFLKWLFSRFGIPRAIISDWGIHFSIAQFAKVLICYGITHKVVTSLHPWISSQVDVSNRSWRKFLGKMSRIIGKIGPINWIIHLGL